MKPLSQSSFALAFAAATLLALGVISFESRSIAATSVMGAVQFGLIVAVAVSVFSSNRAR